jgi:hypothetical protein
MIAGGACVTMFIAADLSASRVGWIAAIALAGAGIGFLTVALVLWCRADSADDRARTAVFLKQYHAALRWPGAFVLLLRAFESRLVREESYELRTAEREELRMVRGEPLPTGRVYSVLEEVNHRTSDVRDEVMNALESSLLVGLVRTPAELEPKPLMIATVSERWEETVTALALGARRIVLVPETARGLVTEVELLRSAGCLGRAVLLMPPSDDRFSAPTPKRFGHTRRAAWEATRQAFPVQLPEYDHEGTILLLADDGAIRQRLPWSAANLRQALEDASSKDSCLAELAERLADEGLLLATINEISSRERSIRY